MSFPIVLIPIFGSGQRFWINKGTFIRDAILKTALIRLRTVQNGLLFFKAVSEGIREFEAIAIAGGPEGAQELNYCPPCGVCRQVMREFCEDDFKIILVKSEEEYKVFTLGELLPQSFWADF